MNQPEVMYKRDKCVKCGNIFLMPYYYDKHLSDWACYSMPICEYCKWKSKGLIREVNENARIIIDES